MSRGYLVGWYISPIPYPLSLAPLSLRVFSIWVGLNYLSDLQLGHPLLDHSIIDPLLPCISLGIYPHLEAQLQLLLKGSWQKLKPSNPPRKVSS